jgi:hypothetical protein
LLFGTLLRHAHPQPLAPGFGHAFVTILGRQLKAEVIIHESAQVQPDAASSTDNGLCALA